MRNLIAFIRAGAIVPAVIVQIEDAGIDNASEGKAGAVNISIFILDTERQ